MRIGIDGGCWSNRRGYGRFLRELLEALLKLDAGHRYTIFLDRASHQSFSLAGMIEPVMVPTAEGVAEGATADGRRSVADLLRMSWAVAQRKLDVFFFPSVYSYFPLLRPVPMILGVHDTMAVRNPQFAFASSRQELFWNCKERLAMAQSRTILTVSEYSSKSIQQWFGIPEDRIRVVYEAASAKFHPGPGIGSEGRYILYVGGISPNKNLATLVEAYARIRPEWKLLLVGDYESDGFLSCYRELRMAVQSSGLESRILFTGYVPDEKLIEIYRGASLFVMPSLDEGFGLPALEAMACGVPIIASDENALAEVVGGAGILVNPRNADALAEAIARVVGDPVLAADLRQRSLARSSQFSWERAAREMTHIFEEAVRR